MKADRTDSGELSSLAVTNGSAGSTVSPRDGPQQFRVVISETEKEALGMLSEHMCTWLVAAWTPGPRHQNNSIKNNNRRKRKCPTADPFSLLSCEVRIPQRLLWIEIRAI